MELLAEIVNNLLVGQPAKMWMVKSRSLNFGYFINKRPWLWIFHLNGNKLRLVGPVRHDAFHSKWFQLVQCHFSLKSSNLDVFACNVILYWLKSQMIFLAQDLFEEASANIWPLEREQSVTLPFFKSWIYFWKLALWIWIKMWKLTTPSRTPVGILFVLERWWKRWNNSKN